MKRVVVALIAGTVLSGLAAAYAGTNRKPEPPRGAPAGEDMRGGGAARPEG